MAAKKIYHHPSGLNQKLVQKVATRRGRLHAFEKLNADTTALVVIDLMTASVKNDENCRSIIEPINDIARTIRSNGGMVAWVTQAPASNGPNMEAMVGSECDSRFVEDADTQNESSKLWHKLNTEEPDIQVTKRGFSAFFPGKCDLPDILQKNNIETVLIAGTVTNICCESSARDAYEHGYKVIMISDANIGHSYGLHEASLNNFYRIFGDVRPSKDIIEMIKTGNTKET